MSEFFNLFKDNFLTTYNDQMQSETFDEQWNIYEIYIYKIIRIIENELAAKGVNFFTIDHNETDSWIKKLQNVSTSENFNIIPYLVLKN